MKKLFTLAAAVLASVAMMAQTITLSTADKSGNWYEVAGVGKVANKSGNAFSDSDMTCVGSTSYKTGSSYFTIQTYQEINSLILWARSTSNRTVSKVSVSDQLSSSAPSATNVEYTVVNEASETYAIVSNDCDNEFTMTFTNPVAADSYIQILMSGNVEIVAVTLVAGEITPSTDPVAVVTIAGPEAVYVGRKASFSATTDVKANAYQWLVNGTEQEGATTAKFDFTPDAEGNYAIVCKAKNDNNSDFVASAAINLVASIKQPAVQVDVTESTTWDWAKAGSATPEQTDETVPSKTQVFNFDDVLIDPSSDFNAAALMGIAQFANRGTYFQGTEISFNTTVPGYVAVTYSNTGGSRPYRHVEVNGTLSAAGSADQTMKNTEAFSVAAGIVTIKFYIPDADTPQARSGDVVGYSMGRISKIIFSTEPIATSISNTNANVKAVKIVRNGQLFIEKNGVVYNAQGAIVK